MTQKAAYQGESTLFRNSSEKDTVARLQLGRTGMQVDGHSLVHLRGFRHTVVVGQQSSLIPEDVRQFYERDHY